MANKVLYLLSAMTSGLREGLLEMGRCSGAARVLHAEIQPAAVIPFQSTDYSISRGLISVNNLCFHYLLN